MRMREQMDLETTQSTGLRQSPAWKMLQGIFWLMFWLIIASFGAIGGESLNGGTYPSLMDIGSIAVMFLGVLHTIRFGLPLWMFMVYGLFTGLAYVTSYVRRTWYWPIQATDLRMLSVAIYSCLIVVGMGLACRWTPCVVSWFKSTNRSGFCSNCEYNLTGNVSGTCPECGVAIPGESSDDSWA